MGPLVRRSWAPRGHTPVLMQRGRYRTNVSVIGAFVITPRRHLRAYFSLSPGASFDGEHILAFLKQLCRAVRAPIELVWDRLPAHRGQPVKGWLERNSHRMRATLLPPYAPELNPVELMWGYAKTNCLANFAPHELDELIDQTHFATQLIRGDRALLESFLQHCALSFRLR
jgi:putative transposase